MIKEIVGAILILTVLLIVKEFRGFETAILIVISMIMISLFKIEDTIKKIKEKNERK